MVYICESPIELVLMEKVAGPIADKSRKYEIVVYATLWLLVIVLPLFNEIMRDASGSVFSWHSILRWWQGLIPFMLVFCVNTFVLFPKLLLKNRVKTYLVLLALVFAVFLAFQMTTFDLRIEAALRAMQKQPAPVARSYYRFMGIPMPILTDMVFLLFLVAINAVVVVIFKYMREKATRESLEKLRLMDELKFLKAQINPHFLMNSLNNIHSMIEIDSEKAQDMTLELSRLMRYVLYEGANSTASFADEVAFILNYVSLMRCRYPDSKVRISLDVPDNPSRNILIPSMMLVTFVENAFKHGISYRMKSSVDISIQEQGNTVMFSCVNSKPKFSDRPSDGGVGLDNVRRRLELMCPDAYQLDIDDSDTSFSVKLIIQSL